METVARHADRLDGVSVFVAVVEAASFSEAARRLSLSKAQVSKQIAALEARLGARLLNRTTRRLSLTEVGANYFERCQRILAEAEAAERAVGALQAEPSGTLRVNAPMSFGVAHMAPLVAEFLGHYPGVAVDLALNDRTIDLVDEGFDLAIRIGALPDSSLTARRLTESRRVLVASPGYLAQRAPPQTIADLQRHDCLCYAYQQSGDVWKFQDGRAAKSLAKNAAKNAVRSVTIQGRLRANNGDVLAQAAIAGLGIALLPSFIVAPALAAGELVELRLDLEPVGLDIHAVYASRRHLPVKTTLFVDFLVRRFAALPPWEMG